MGFRPCSREFPWMVPLSECLPVMADIERMCLCFDTLTLTAASTATATVEAATTIRTCCKDRCYVSTLPTELSEKDIFVFEHFDAYETSNGSFVARCILCSNTSDPFLGVHFNELYYSFALSHLPRCHGLRKDRKLYDAYHDMQCDLQATLTQDETEHHQFLLQRNNWIQMYYSLVSKSSCHPGCGDPSALNQNQALSKLASLAASLESIELHEQLINMLAFSSISCSCRYLHTRHVH